MALFALLDVTANRRPAVHERSTTVGGFDATRRFYRVQVPRRRAGRGRRASTSWATTGHRRGFSKIVTRPVADVANVTRVTPVPRRIRRARDVRMFGRVRR